MSGEVDFPISSKKPKGLPTGGDIEKRTTFNQRKEIWLMKKLSQEGPPTEEEVQEILARLPLKYRALSALLRDASNVDLLIIKHIFDGVISSRSQPIEIVLKREKYVAGLDWGRDVFDELGRTIAKDYVEEHFPDLNEKTRRQLATYLSWNTMSLEKGPPTKKSGTKGASQYQKILDAYNKRLEEERATREKITKKLINVFGEERLGIINADYKKADEEGEFVAYYSDEPDSDCLVSAIKNLEHRKVEVKTMLLYTLELPLGASYEIGFDAKYGEYPIISGCHY